MHRARKFFRQSGMDTALTLDARYALESIRHHADMEVCFADGAIGPQRAGMAGMAVAFIGDDEHGRRKCGGQFPLDGVCCAHAGEGLHAQG